jgi:hypothetical protein
MKILTTPLLFFLHTFISFAQEPCNAAYYFEQVACSEEVNKCVMLTAKVDPAGKKLDYVWNMGDGQIEKGAVVEHCYTDFGGYSISLDLLNEKEGIHIKNELTKSIVIAPLPVLLSEENIWAGQTTTFKYRYDLPNGVIINQILWSFGDGTYFCGTEGLHTYKSQGQFDVRVMLRGTYQGEEVVTCGSSKILVKDGNLDGHLIVDLFEQKEKELDLGKRFLEDLPHLFIFPSDGNKKATIIDIERKNHFVEIEAETNYSMFAYKGNLYVGPVNFYSGTPQMANDNLMKAINQLFQEKVDVIKPIIFETDSYKVNTGELSGLVNLAKEVPDMTLRIGTYTHTGGRIERNLALAAKRGKEIATALQNQGIAHDRLFVYTAKEDARLFNSCYGIEGCTLENTAYNGKSEIKIRIED